MFNRLYITFVAVVALLCSCSSDKPDSLEPHLQTLPATDITRTEATISGRCQTDNGVEMPQLWFCYGVDESMSERSETLEAADGSVSMRLRNLTAGTTYYYMLQGGNGTAVLSGETLNFTTLPNLQPTIGDVKVLSSSPMSVIVGYRIADDGGDEIAESGCRISRQDGSAMSDGEKETTIMQTGSVGADGFYRLRIGNLQPSTAYTICPFAKNRNGEAVGEPLSFTTPTAVVLDEAGMLSVVIGDDIYKYTTISIAGPLNGDDLRTLRHMAGRGIDGSATNGRLADIDISGARIVAGGGVYDAARYSEDDVVGVGLFAACNNLKNIKLPMDVVRIEKDAFLNCSSLRSIVIPATVSNIVPSAGCTSLEEISVSGANTAYTSSDGVLLSGDAKSILWFPMGKRGDYALPATVTAVGPYAFRECSIEKFVFPAGLTKIGECAFYNSKVKEVALPSTLKLLPTGVFQKCADLKTVRLGDDVELLSDYVFDGCPLTDLYITAPLPPVCGSNTFATTGADFVKTCRLHVPKGRKKYYRANAKWNVFDNIVEE
ncbi:MAG: leucine-rich repeat protein [Prevotella sp.]|nr:leucine-rich repeat protein [Prevotella sp.]